MASTNEHISSPAKRLSPLEFRNTDLVSRLLAATPPYLYNMSLLPNTFFFSEMLRSFVQAKSEHNRNATLHASQRRPRKRTWSTARAESFLKVETSSKLEGKSEVDWMLKSNHLEKKPEIENPLELTINKTENNNDNNIRNNIPDYQNKIDGFAKPELPSNETIFPMHPSLTQAQDNNTNIVLPPPPPMWYPPLYPAPPYGIDPLHFFIDLRVSGHIYDRKNHQQKDSVMGPPAALSSSPPKDKLPINANAIESKMENALTKDLFRPSRHSSAFSVPIPSGSKSSPINLSYFNQFENNKEYKQTKFDVKSMGFDKNCNKTSTNYIMNNINNIYNTVHITKEEKVKQEETITKLAEENNQNFEDARYLRNNKDVKNIFDRDLVDYMDSRKSGRSSNSTTESSNSTDIESIASPALEVVALQDD